MATRWKDMIKKAKPVLKKDWQIIPGVILAAVGLIFFYGVAAYPGDRPTTETLGIGLIGNVLFGPGMGILLWKFLKLKYENWLPEDEGFYEQWKVTGKKLRKYLCITGAVALFLAYWYLTRLMNGGLYGWYWNYAPGYMMIFSVLVQFMVCWEVIRRFMNSRLELLMTQMEQINKKRLAEAMEIERKSLEKVSRSDQLRVDLITNVSHDLKTPLTSMVGYIELIRKEELSDVVRDYVDVLSERAEKLKEMINSLFNLAKASSGNVELHPEKFKLNRMIEQIFADMDDRIKASGLEFVTLLSEENTDLVSDNSYFYRICQNLMENALKYSAKGTRVFVKTYVKNPENGEGDRKLCLEITNTSSYPMDFTKEEITERFARGDKARSGDGNGLGLAIVSTYAKALGGEFDIKIDCDQFKACLEMPGTL